MTLFYLLFVLSTFFLTVGYMAAISAISVKLAGAEQSHKSLLLYQI